MHHNLNMENEKTLTICAVASIVGCCSETVRRYDDQGLLDGVIRDTSNNRLFSQATAEQAKRIYESRKNARK